jgi:TonB family protein
MRIFGLRFTLVVFLLAIPACAQTPDPQHILDQYRNRIFVIRGFFPGDHLHFSSTGVSDNTTNGDWTTDGLVELNDLSISNRVLTIRAKRLFVSTGRNGFQFLADTPKKRKKAPKLRMDVELGPDENPANVLLTIFLTAQDIFSNLVPAYWKSCVSEGLNGKNAQCRFGADIAAIPGVATSQNIGSSVVAVDNSANKAIARIGHGVTPPRVVSRHDPNFSDAARGAKFQGTAVLMLVVNTSGVPTNIRVVNPLGLGLDEKAVEAVENWRFQPSEKDGTPVAVEIAVQVDFHLY